MAHTLNKFQPKLQSVQAENGEYISDKEGIAERWKQYCEELYNDVEGREHITGYEREPPPLRSEVARAIRQVASGKTAGPDGVPAELFKYGGEKILEKMHYICTALWEDGEWPDDWIESIFVPIPKKGDARQCSNHRTVALVAHASKIILRIILERIRNQTESEVAEEQAGFRKARGTRDQITNLRIIMQKANEHQQPLFMCFVDFKKAFDSIAHETLWMTMIEMGFPGHIINLLTKLYWEQKARVKVAGTLSEEFRVRRGVRQGCVLSPSLFNILAERVMREALEGYDGGVQIGGRRLTNLQYADDIVLLISSEEELQMLIERLDRIGKKYGMQFNIGKTKVMTTTETKCTIKINQEELEQVDRFT